MTNNEIIINQAIAHGIYTKAEAQAIVAAKGCLPIHTFAEWKKAGYSVKRGEHAAITCDLWKYTERPGKAAKAARAEAAKAGQNSPDADAPDPHYYMAKAHLFTRDQVKPAGQDDAPKAKTPEEIAARNAELAAARKARKAAQQVAATTAPATPTVPASTPTPEPSKPAAVVAVVEHHALHDDGPAPEPVQLDFATIAAQVLA